MSPSSGGKAVRAAPKTGPKALGGSAEARRSAAVILEALGGLKSTQEASAELGVALPRYYVLETRALAGMIQALEPRPRGRVRRPEDEVSRLRQENESLRREARRQQALYRSAQRVLGIKEGAATRRTRQELEGKKPRRTRKTRRVRRNTRGEQVRQVLLERGKETAEGKASDEETGKAKPGSVPRGRAARRAGGAATTARDPGDPGGREDGGGGES